MVGFVTHNKKFLAVAHKANRLYSQTQSQAPRRSDCSLCEVGGDVRINRDLNENQLARQTLAHSLLFQLTPLPPSGSAADFLPSASSGSLLHGTSGGDLLHNTASSSGDGDGQWRPPPRRNFLLW